SATVPAVVAVIGIAPTNESVVVTASERTWRRPGQHPARIFQMSDRRFWYSARHGPWTRSFPARRGSSSTASRRVGVRYYQKADRTVDEGRSISWCQRNQGAQRVDLREHSRRPSAHPD